jgi:serine phosphatase RsbU (regulator of sigma subunit)
MTLDDPLTRERAARVEAERTLERMRRLQGVTEAFSAALGAVEVGEVVVGQARAALGASASALAFVEDGDVVVSMLRGFEPELVERWMRFPLDASTPLGEAIGTGRLVLLEDREAWRRRFPAVRLLGDHQAAAAIPLVFHGRVLGAMALSFDAPREFSRADREFVLALARQAAQALERARLYDELTYVARTLQDGLLPRRLPAIPGLEVAVRYHSIADGGEVGGDFYDVIDCGGARWLALVGDVCGKGIAAASLSGLARHTLRAIAPHENDPAAMLAFLNDALLAETSARSFVSVGCAVLTPRPEGGLRAILSSAGHPYPLLVPARGPLEEIPVPGTLLGIEPIPDFRRVAVELTPGDTLLLYSDGVLDARDGGNRRFGEERLRRAVAAVAGQPAEAVAEAVDAAMRRHQVGPARDDSAVLALRAARPTLSG